MKKLLGILVIGLLLSGCASPRSSDSNIRHEVNVYFENKKFIDSYKVDTNYKARYFFRVVTSKTYIKDDIRDFFSRIFNFFS